MAFLKNAINALDPAPDKKTELTLALNLLFELAQQKNDSFQNAIKENLRTAGTENNRSVPVKEILAWHKETRAYVKADAGALVDKVTDAVRDFISGGADNIVTGIGKLVTTGLEAIIGSGTGTQAEMSSYYIVVQSYGIARYDIHAWSRHIEATGITSQIETALAFTAAQSSVDVNKITYNTFLIAYGDQLSKMGFTPQEIEEYLDYAEKIFNKLRSGDADMASRENMALGAQGVLAPSMALDPDFQSPGALRGTLW